MDLNIQLVDGYEGVQVHKINITDDSGVIFEVTTIADTVSVEEILALGRYNRHQLTLVVS